MVHARPTFGHGLREFLQVVGLFQATAGETGGCGKFCVAMIQQPVSVVTLAGWCWPPCKSSVGSFKKDCPKAKSKMCFLPVSVTEAETLLCSNW